jgi:hypothetical protein
MALIIARGRRRDRFGQCLLHFDDLPHEDARALVCSLAAAFRRDIIGANGQVDADRLLSGAVAQVMARHDGTSSIENLTATLVGLLDEEGELGDDLVAAAAVEGEMNFVAQALARRSSVLGEIALGELLSGDSKRIMGLLRMARLPRETVAAILAAVGDLVGIDDPGRAIAHFDQIGDADVAAALGWVSSDQLYQRAVSALGESHGQRSV